MLLEIHDFILETSYNVSILCDLVFDVVHIALHVGLNVLGSVGILERVVSLLETLASTCDVGDHHCPAVATQTVFEQTSQLRISVRNVVLLSFRAVLVERVDAVSEGEERPIDVCTLDHTHATIICLLGSFRAGQVDQRQLSDVNFCTDACTLLCVLADDLEDGVRA